MKVENFVRDDMRKRGEGGIQYNIDVQRLTLGPNDTVVLIADRPLDEYTARRMKEQIKGALPAGARVIVLDSTISIGVISGDEVAA